MLECRSQASFTARRLVGQMRNERHQNKRALPERHQRRTFRYSFSPTQEAQDHDDEAPASVAAGKLSGLQFQRHQVVGETESDT